MMWCLLFSKQQQTFKTWVKISTIRIPELCLLWIFIEILKHDPFASTWSKVICFKANEHLHWKTSIFLFIFMIVLLWKHKLKICYHKLNPQAFRRLLSCTIVFFPIEVCVCIKSDIVNCCFPYQLCCLVGWYSWASIKSYE